MRRPEWEVVFQGERRTVSCPRGIVNRYHSVKKSFPHMLSDVADAFFIVGMRRNRGRVGARRRILRDRVFRHAAPSGTVDT